MATSATATPPEYILGTGADELARLAFQNRLWSDAAHEAWKLARIAPGQRVLDIGCGPGFASFDLAELVGKDGHVAAIDESPGFIAHLRDQARERRLPQLKGHTGDVQMLADYAALAGEGPFDIAYARWVLCFVSRPVDVVANAARLLKPGGRLVVHDYFNYAAMRVAPMGTPFAALYERIVAATDKSWRGRGGDPDVVGRLPGFCIKAGLKVTSMRAHQRIARPGETMFHWAGTWWKNYVPKLAEMRAISAADRDGFFTGWAELEASQDGWITCPCVFEVIAEKP
jgi:SAM-dependent methyltransferase